MSAFLLTLALFLGWSLVGLALLALVRADTSQLRIVLAAPVLGTCVTVLVVFLFSEAGVAIERCAVPIAIGLGAASMLILVLRRPRVHLGALAVVLVCIGGLLLVSPPMFAFGFGWLANGNDDMANYVLSAQDLLRHGLLAPVDVSGLLQGRDYATVLTELHVAGARPGSDMLLAFVSRVAGLAPYEAFMPVIVAFSLCGASAVGALALQFARRWWAGVVAAALVLVSPMATYGVLQQLLGQVWGLGIVAALLALLMRPELHEGDGPRAADVIPIAVLVGGLFLGYVELVPEMGLAYLIYVGVLAVHGRLSRVAVARLWLPTVAIVVVVLNSYFFTELGFLRTQSTHGLSTSGYPPLFGYVMVPSALPGALGLQTLPPGFDAPHLNLTIVLAMVVIGATIVASVLGTIRGSAAAIVLLVEAALGVLIVVKNSDFGIFKLTMYVQPFFAALVAAALTRITRRALAAVCALGVLLVFVAQLSTQRAYVNASRDPSDVPNLSAAGLLGHFRAVAAHASSVVSVSTNPVVVKLEAASAEGTRVYFQSRDVFSNLLKGYNKESRPKSHGRAERALTSGSGAWVSRSFSLLGAGGQDRFEEDTAATASLRSGRCTLVMPGPQEEPINRDSLPASSPYLAAMPCTAPHDLLAFTSSSLGESFYLPFARKNVSYYQLQQDPLYPSQTMVGFGRYALFQVLGWTPGARMKLSLTATLTHDGVNALPLAAVVGATRVPFALVGRGSARVISAPVTPQIVAGVPYLLLDMGVQGRLPSVEHSGLQGLYGRSVPTDPRYLSAYVRDVSLLSPERYAGLAAPRALSSFPASLNDDNLEYSGIYEDGWLDGDSYVRLAGGPKADLIVQGQVPVGAGKHLQVLVDGHLVASRAVGPGPLDLRVAVPASAEDHRVELRFAATIKLAAPDLRPAAIHLAFLGFGPAAKG